MTPPIVNAAQVEVKVTQFNNEEALLKRINPDLWRIYRALMVIIKFGGNGSVEAHFSGGRIKDQNGLYIKPGFHDSVGERNGLL